MSAVEELLFPGGRNAPRVVTAKRPLTVEHICDECDFFYQMPVREIGTTNAQAAEIERACMACEQPMRIYAVYGGEYEAQLALFGEEKR